MVKGRTDYVDPRVCTHSLTQPFTEPATPPHTHAPSLTRTPIELDIGMSIILLYIAGRGLFVLYIIWRLGIFHQTQGMGSWDQMHTSRKFMSICEARVRVRVLDSVDPRPVLCGFELGSGLVMIRMAVPFLFFFAQLCASFFLYFLFLFTSFALPSIGQSIRYVNVGATFRFLSVKHFRIPRSHVGGIVLKS